MDFLTKHWAAFPRGFPCGLPLGTSDFLPGKTAVLERSFETCNFSIILRGQGFFERAGRRWEFHAPFVITQWPGESLRYGPLNGSWDEWYLVYHRSLFHAFRKRGFIDPEKPLWPVADPAALTKCFEEFRALACAARPEACADLADRVAERAVLVSLLAPAEPDDELAALRSMSDQMRARPGVDWDFGKIGRQLGYSPATFRRRWKSAMGTAPAGWLANIRMAEAGRLLAESSLRIKEIAAATGFGDELYFSRRFHSTMGVSPREYRKCYRVLSGSFQQLQSNPES